MAQSSPSDVISIIKLVNLTEHCAVTNSWLKDMQYASSKCSVGSHCTLRGQWLGVHSALGVTHPFDTRPLFHMWTKIFLGLCGPPDQSFCHGDQNFYDRPLFHTQTAIFLHQIIIPSWQLTVSMHEIGSLICNQHDKLMVKMTILFLLWWNFQKLCRTNISVTEHRKLLGTAFTFIAFDVTLSPCLQQNLLAILELALCIHEMSHGKTHRWASLIWEHKVI